MLGTTDGGRQNFLSWNMDTNPGWTLQGQWAWGQPAGAGGDPTAGYDGSNVIGYNLAGQYSNNMSAYYATTPAFSTLGKTQVQLSFYRWLGVESDYFDSATINVSRDGSTWTSVWANPTTTITDTAWSLQTFDISAVADNQPQVYLRWGMGPTDISVTYCGWNIDNVTLSAAATVTSDYYSVSLAAGQSLTAGLASLASDTATLRLYNSSQTLLATGVSSSNMNAVINNYVAASAGTFYLQITGNGAGTTSWSPAMPPSIRNPTTPSPRPNR